MLPKIHIIWQDQAVRSIIELQPTGRNTFADAPCFIALNRVRRLSSFVGCPTRFSADAALPSGVVGPVAERQAFISERSQCACAHSSPHSGHRAK